MKINTHFDEKGTIPSFKIGCLIWLTKQKIKKQKSQSSLITFKGDNETKHFIIATIIEQSGNQ